MDVNGRLLDHTFSGFGRVEGIWGEGRDWCVAGCVCMVVLAPRWHRVAGRRVFDKGSPYIYARESAREAGLGGGDMM